MPGFWAAGGVEQGKMGDVGMDSTLKCRWLGVAGLEFTLDGVTLLIDPHFTRPSKAAVLGNRRVVPDRAEIARRVTRADYVLITHPHYDHVMDVPEVLRLTGARAYGSPNTAALLALHSCAAEVIQTGDRLALGPFAVEVFPAEHTPIPLPRLFNGPLPAHLRSQARDAAPVQNAPPQFGAPPPKAAPPPHLLTVPQPRARFQRAPQTLRLSDYRMDACYSFRIHAAGQVILVGNHPVPADGLFIAPYRKATALHDLLLAIQPKWVMPIHWDDFMRPLSLPLLPMLLTPAQGLPKPFPPIQRMNVSRFVDAVRAVLPETWVIIPDIFEGYDLGNF